MRVLIVALGTMGDVAPYTGLAARLGEGGHEVAVAAYARFAGMVRATGAEFREVSGDPAAAGGWTQAEDGRQAIRSMRESVLDRGRVILDAARSHRPDVLLLSLPAMPGLQVAESLGIPCAGVFLDPLYPTAEYPPTYLPISRSLGPWGNRTAHHLMNGVFSLLLDGATNQLRAGLGLPALSRREIARQIARTPVLHGISPAALPRPADWPETMEMSGYLWPAVAPGWRPPADLADFLAAGPPPVFVGFGSRSMSGQEAEKIAGIVGEALRRTGRRGVLQAGWAGLTGHSDDVVTIGETPHEWLFPRMAAVVHHAGAGTTAAGLRAGVPTVTIPILGSQPFWGGRIEALGAGPAPVPYRKLSVDRLTAAISAAVSRPGYRAAAEALSGRIAAEDGAGRVLAALDRLAGRAAADDRT
ncbi:glycosyltransferase [Microbispora sp. H10949]|uniref:glycosyltransferase n=1 Tax=Microbispora sp. H10949 TaxID=2729111 RepID=UPI001603819F|nr:glycosyltransferase [Microbispora sp. H10949]